MSYGRRKIFADAREITLENVVEEVRKAVLVHDSNRNEINKLYDYYRGKTPILTKQKETRSFRFFTKHRKSSDTYLMKSRKESLTALEYLCLRYMV